MRTLLLLLLVAIVAVVATAGCGSLTTTVETPQPVVVVPTTPDPVEEVEDPPTTPAPVAAEALVDKVHIEVNVGRQFNGVAVGAQAAASLTPKVGKLKAPETPVKIEVGVEKRRDLQGITVGLPTSSVQVEEDLAQRVSKSFYDKASVLIIKRNRYEGIAVGVKKTGVSVDPQ